VEDDVIKGITEKPGIGNEPSDMINIVVHLHKDINSLIKCIEKTKSAKDDIYEKAMDRMMKEGVDFRVARYEGGWTAIKYPWHILDVIKHFLDKIETNISEDATISERATVGGEKIIIESGVKVFENAVVKGPCYIGRDTVIGNNALVRDYCHLGEKVVVGFSTEIKTSYIDDDSWFHMNYVGDSIIGQRCNLGAGTKFANLRLDGKNIVVVLRGETVDTGLTKLGAIMGDGVKTGINSSIEPGTIIGEHSYIGPNSLARGNIAPKSRIH
jgi:bifunctional UDP-N-acetylglucosamine pyrophosphorylase/glucosamine-1-phosphate N-acetyltransferase